MSWIDLTLWYAARVAAIAWLLWGVLNLIDIPVTGVLKWIQSYWRIVEFCWYREQFYTWMKDTKQKRYTNSDGTLYKPEPYKFPNLSEDDSKEPPHAQH